MKECYIYLGVKRTELDLVDQILDLIENNPELSDLKSYILKTESTIDKLNKFAEDSIKRRNKEKSEGKYKGIDDIPDTSKLIGVNRYIDAATIDGKQLLPVFDEKRYIEHAVEMERKKGGPDFDATAYRKKVLREFRYKLIMSKYGTFAHDLISKYLTGTTDAEINEEIEKFKEELIKTRDGKSYALLRSLVEDVSKYKSYFKDSSGKDIVDVRSDKINEAVQELIENTKTLAENMATQIREKFGKDCTIFSEVDLYVTLKECPGLYMPLCYSPHKTGLHGIADLIIVYKDEHGSERIAIGDFKFANTEYEKWSAAKLYHTQYLLGMYRQMLDILGFDRRKIDTYTIPIYFKTGDALDMSLHSEFAINEGVAHVSAGGINRLGETGLFTLNIRQLLPSNNMFKASKSNEVINNKIKENWEKIIGWEETRHKKTTEQIKKYISEPHAGSTDYTLAIPHTNIKFKHSTLEEFEKKTLRENPVTGVREELSDIEVFLLYDEMKVSNIMKKLSLVIKTFKDKRTPISEQEYIGKNLTIPQEVYRKTFGKYTNEQWEFIENDILFDHGILMFRHSSGLIECVTLTQRELEEIVHISGLAHLVGKFKSDTEINTPVKAENMNYLLANVKNLKMMEVMNVLNTLAEENIIDLKSGHPFSISNITVLNTGSRSSTSREILDSAYKDNFSYLCSKAGIKNNFYPAGKNYLKITPAFKTYLTQVMDLVSAPDFNNKEIKGLIEMLDGGDYSKDLLCEQLENIIKKFKARYPKFQYSNLTDHRQLDIENSIDEAYFIMSSILTQLRGITIMPDGSYSNWGLHIDGLFRALKMVYKKETAVKSAIDTNDVSFLGGMNLQSPETVPDRMMRELTARYKGAMDRVRREYLKEMTKIDKMTGDYLKLPLNKSFLNNNLINDPTKAWKRLLLKNNKGEIHESLSLMNPYDSNSHLNEDERKFVSKILWEMAKYRIAGLEIYRDWDYASHEVEILGLSQVQDAIADGSYFWLPLMTAKFAQKFHGDITVKDWWSNAMTRLNEVYDPQVDYATKSRHQNNQIKTTDLYNPLVTTKKVRERVLKELTSVGYFEFDLDVLVKSLVAQTLRTEHFKSQLLLTDCVASVIHFLKGMYPNQDFKDKLEFMEKEALIILRDETIVKKELQGALKAVGTAQKITSSVALGYRPLHFVKEMTMGLFTNYSRVWAMRGSSNEISFKNTLKANLMIWGQSINKYAQAATGGNTEITDFTLCEMINKFYGIANEDFNRLALGTYRRRKGILGASDLFQYLPLSAADYGNRLTLFVAKMLEDGSFEAHSLDKDGNIIYDWKKDTRFSELAKYGINSNHNSTKFQELLSLYHAMCESFLKNQGYSNLISWDKNLKREVYLDLPAAYTTEQRNSMKEVADIAYGYFDHETKSMIYHMWMGKLFLQFLTWLSSMIKRWVGVSPKNIGDNTSLGKLVPKKRNGEYIYRRLVYSEDGEFQEIQEVPESLLEPDEKGKLKYVMEWQGDFVEGYVHSILSLIRDVCTMNWEEVTLNKARMRNAMLGLHDFMIGWIMYMILKWLFSGGTDKMQDIAPLQRTLVRAASDLGPQGLGSFSLTPAFVRTFENLKNDTLRAATSDDFEFQDLLLKNIGALKDFLWEEH